MSHLLRTIILAAAGGGALGVAAAIAHERLGASAPHAVPGQVILAQLDGQSRDATPVPPRRPPLFEQFPVPPLQERFRDRAPQGERPASRRAPQAEQSRQEKPAEEAKKPQTREEMLEELYSRLAKAKDVNEARGIVQAIERMWLVSGSDTADLLMSRAQEAIQKKNQRLARRMLDKVIDLQPEWAEGWSRRATLRFQENDLDGAIADIGKVLAIEPRHFRALTGLGFIMKREGFNKQALQAFRKALEVNPQQERIRKEVEQLTQDVEGRDI